MSRGHSYAHMCRDEHIEIGHNDSEHELCPLCRAINERDTAFQRGQQAMAEKYEIVGYGYRYPDGVRFGTGGRGINGNAPIETFPIYRSLASAEPPQGEAEPRECQGGYCRDEMLWRRTLAEARLDEAKEWDTTAQYHITRWVDLNWRKERLAELDSILKSYQGEAEKEGRT